jgi:hypothetical protein
MSCGFDESLLHAYVDEELSSDEKTKVLGHIVWCEHCRKEVENIKKMSKGIKETFSRQAPISALEAIQRGIESVGVRKGRWAFGYHMIAAAAALVIVSVVALEIFRAGEENQLPGIAGIRAPALRDEGDRVDKTKSTAEGVVKEAGKTEQLEMTVDSFLAPPTAEKEVPAVGAPAVEAAKETAPVVEPAPAKSAVTVRKAGAKTEEQTAATAPPSPAVKSQTPAPVVPPRTLAQTEAKNERGMFEVTGGEGKKLAAPAAPAATPTKDEKRATAEFGRTGQPVKEGTVAAHAGKPAAVAGAKPPMAAMAREAEAALKGKEAGEKATLAEAAPAKPVAAQAVVAQAPSEMKKNVSEADKQAGAVAQDATAANAVGVERAKTASAVEPAGGKAGPAMQSVNMQGLVTEWSPIIRLSATGQRSARVMTLRQAQVLGAIVVSVAEPVHREGMDITTRRTLSWNEQMVKIFVLEAKPAQDAPVHIMQRTEGWVKAEEGVVPISEEVPYMVMPDKPITETGRYATITVVTQDRR